MKYEVTGIDAIILGPEPALASLHLDTSAGALELTMQRQQLDRLVRSITTALRESDATTPKDHSGFEGGEANRPANGGE